MPSSQTPRADIPGKPLKSDNMNAFLGDLDKQMNPREASTSKESMPSDASLARRKTIDRRDKEKRVEDDRRASDRRQKKNSKKTEAERKEEQDELILQQHRKKILLAGCEPVMGFNYDYLAMDDYPENSIVSAARRDRDYWLAVCSIFFAIFFFGLLGFIPAGIAGASCGLGVLSVFFAFSPFRRFFFQRPRLNDLLQKRKSLEFRALNHIRLLEGQDGLAWRCGKLKKYNTNLSKKLFSGLYHYSKERKLLSIISQKKHIRLYLLLMIESQKAYKRLEKDYLEHHFKHLEEGINDRIDANEANKLEQLLNVSRKKA